MTKVNITEKADLLKRIENDWQEINSLLASLTDEEFVNIKDNANWSVKDHIAHLHVWEQATIAFLQGIPRYKALGVSKEIYRSMDIDKVNHVIFQTYSGISLPEIRTRFQVTHQALLNELLLFTDDQLNKPSSYFLEEQVFDEEGPPAIQIIYASTGLHFREHQAYIQAMLT